MSQNIQLQQVVVDGMVIKMGGDRGGGHIIGRALNRRKRVDLLSHRQNDDTARMLSRGTPHAHTALDDPVDLTVPFPVPALFIIVFHITISCLIRQRTDGSRPEGLSLSENNLRIIVGMALVLTGEVQVDIRLLISLKSKERLKWNVVSVLFQHGPTHRAFLIRHITSGHTGVFLYLFRIKIGIMAFGAVIMRT